MKNDPYAKDLAGLKYRQRVKPSKRQIRKARIQKAILKEALFEEAVEREEREEYEAQMAHNLSLRYPGC